MPNARGIPTKKKPTMDEDAFFTDEEYDDNIKIIDKAFEPVDKAIEDDKVIVLPEDGLGTGRADLQNKAPKTFEYLEAKIEAISKPFVIGPKIKKDVDIKPEEEEVLNKFEEVVDDGILDGQEVNTSDEFLEELETIQTEIIELSETFTIDTKTKIVENQIPKIEELIVREENASNPNLKYVAKMEVLLDELKSVYIPDTTPIQTAIPGMEPANIFKNTVQSVSEGWSWTKGQKKALKIADKLIIPSQDNIFKTFSDKERTKIIGGYAGTGKTTIVANIVRQASRAGYKVHVAAPTNKAVVVLDSKLEKQGIKGESKQTTLHKMIYGAPDPKTGQFKRSFELDAGDFVIIDEASMINQELYDDIVKNVINKGARVIFMGDNYQLAPVGQDPKILENAEFFISNGGTADWQYLIFKHRI